MSTILAEQIAQLEDNGWILAAEPVVLAAKTPVELPEGIAQRYDWLPDSVMAFLAGVKSAVSVDEKSWFVTSSVLAANSDSAFRWNQWELDSLSASGDDAAGNDTAGDDAASNDAAGIAEIVRFWDQHFPVLLSVKNSYSYLAVRPDGKIVHGNEPEYEQTSDVAESFDELIGNIARIQAQLQF